MWPTTDASVRSSLRRVPEDQSSEQGAAVNTPSGVCEGRIPEMAYSHYVFVIDLQLQPVL